MRRVIAAAVAGGLVLDLCWPLSMRTKQYAGIVNVTIHRITLTIDKDVVGGLMATSLPGTP